MPNTQPERLWPLKLMMSVVAIAALLVKIKLDLDATSVGLLILATLPWLSPLIKSAQLPGGIGIEFQDIKRAADRVAGGAPALLGMVKPLEPSYLTIAEADPRLAVVALRLEIEKRLRGLAEAVGVPNTQPLSQLVRDLQRKQVISAESAGGLLDLIALGNQASHGVAVSGDAARAAVEDGPRVLGVLDARLMEQGATRIDKAID